MHPNGQLPAYEWNFSDVNPPVHAWAAWRVYKMEHKRTGAPTALSGAHLSQAAAQFHLVGEPQGRRRRNVFQGGFLGLDNIGVFDRSEPLPGGGFIEQADGTGWMAMYSLNLLAIALELARDDPPMKTSPASSGSTSCTSPTPSIISATTARACGMSRTVSSTTFCTCPTAGSVPMKVRSMVGLIPLLRRGDAGAAADRAGSPGFKRRMEWFIANRRDLTGNVASMAVKGQGERSCFPSSRPDQLRRILKPHAG
jgi:hypothetical protein